MAESAQFSIPYAKPYFPNGSSNRLLRVFDSGQISGSGESLEHFQKQVREILKSEAVLGVSNGSAAIRLAFQALNMRPGRRVILPGWGFHVAANVAFSMGANIEFRDVSQDSWCLEIETIQDLLETEEETIVVLIHTLGNSSSLKHADKFRATPTIKIIEDSAEAFLSEVEGRQLGTIFDIGTYSMHAAKTITTGEGGFVSINDTSLVEKTRLLRNHGMDPKNPYTHLFAGDNFRISNLLAELAIPQLEVIDLIYQERLRVYRRYQDNLKGLPAATFLNETDTEGFFPWGVCVRFEGVDSKFIPNLRAHLQAKGVDTRPAFTSAEQLPYYLSTVNAAVGSLAVSNSLSIESLILPQFVELSNDDIDYICEIIQNFALSN
jgi:perosamine synthetase